MKSIPIFSSLLLMGALTAADESIQYIGLEVPSLAKNTATLRIVVRGLDGKASAVSEPLVVDVMDADGGKKPIATITVKPGESSAEATVARKLVDDEMERSRIKGLIRVGDTGLYAGEVTLLPATTSNAN